ncbi:hypothetical protein [Microlunatus flavus]|uniref:DUF4430 domain-containing protein n=1 Tax=Microlunatus flavus TaxID=1036181 RepID=A0A1H9ADA7_9ACTN|nr:hypothetical protein [Microlunatus flavus]SEP74423.1 hypothetical protein SAMN05421756_101560 [Microlunatus flavus]
MTLPTTTDGAPVVRRRVLLVVVAALAVVALVVAVSQASTALPRVPAAYAGGGERLPPWPAPADPAVGVRAAGLDAAPSEGVVQHFHVHLDVLVDGRPVPVPANLGIDVQRQLYAELHTHADSGVVHAEAADPDTAFTLGQLFVEWGVRLDERHLGGLQSGGGKRLWAFVDGRPLDGDPAALRLVDHQEIVLAFGPEPPSPVPSGFDFVAHPT